MERQLPAALLAPRVADCVEGVGAPLRRRDPDARAGGEVDRDPAGQKKSQGCTILLLYDNPRIM